MTWSIWMNEHDYFSGKSNNGVNCAYEFTTGGSITSQFLAPSGFSRGLGVDSNRCIWHSDVDADSVWKLDQSGSEISSFSSPSARPGGVGVDANDSIWLGVNSSDSIYKLDSTGSVISGHNTPSIDSRGVGVAPDGCLWIGEYQSDSMYETDTAGSVISSFGINNPQGVGVDQDGCIWATAGGKMNQINQSGSVISSFDNPCNYVAGVGVEDTHAGGGQAGSSFYFTGDETIRAQKN